MYTEPGQDLISQELRKSQLRKILSPGGKDNNEKSAM